MEREKRKILGENTARLYGIDIAAQSAKLSRDGIGRGRRSGSAPISIQFK